MRFLAVLAVGALLLVVAGLVVTSRQLLVVTGLVLTSSQRDRADCIADRGDQDRSISGCTRIIQEVGETQQNRAIAYINRASAYVRKGDNDRAIADASEAIRLDPANAFVYGIRAAVHLHKRDLDGAIADAGEAIRLDAGNSFAFATRGGAYFNNSDLDRAIMDAGEAIRLDPGNAVARANRAGIYVAMSDYDRAMVDASEAIRLDPQSAGAHFVRGLANLYTGALPEAFADLNQASMLAPTDAYLALWAEIVGQRSNLPSRLPQVVSQIDMTAWPAPLIRLSLGQLLPAAALAAAANESSRGQVCEANFYVGELALRAGEKDVAIRLFHAAASECPKAVMERESADAELKALGEAP